MMRSVVVLLLRPGYRVLSDEDGCARNETSRRDASDGAVLAMLLAKLQREVHERIRHAATRRRRPHSKVNAALYAIAAAATLSSSWSSDSTCSTRSSIIF